MPRKTTSGAESLRRRGLVALPLSLTRQERDLVREAAQRSGCAAVSDFALPLLLAEAAKVIPAKDLRRIMRNEEKDSKGIVS